MALSPIFIGGCDRSGTTMLGSMLGAHSECLCIPEAHFVVDAIHWTDEGTAAYDPALVRREIAAHSRFRLWGTSLQSDPRTPEPPDGSYPQLIEGVVRRYGEQHGASPGHFWVDQTPWNTRFAATLFGLFPRAKMIHIVRDGRAVAASILPLDWGPSRIDAAATWWSAQVAFGLGAELRWGSERVMRVRYEELLREPEPTLRALCAFVGLEYEPAMALGTGLRVPEYTSREHALVGQPPEASRIDAWRGHLTLRQVEIFERVTGDFLECLGYEPLFGPRARPMTPREVIFSTLGEASGVIAKRIRHRLRKWRYRSAAAARPVIR